MVASERAHPVLAVHGVAAAAAVHVLVDEPRRDEGQARVALVGDAADVDGLDPLAEAQPTDPQAARGRQPALEDAVTGAAHVAHGRTTICPACSTATSGVLRATDSSPAGSPSASAPAMRSCGARMRSA